MPACLYAQLSGHPVGKTLRIARVSPSQWKYYIHSSTYPRRILWVLSFFFFFFFVSGGFFGRLWWRCEPGQLPGREFADPSVETGAGAGEGGGGGDEGGEALGVGGLCGTM